MANGRQLGTSHPIGGGDGGSGGDGAEMDADDLLGRALLLRLSPRLEELRLEFIGLHAGGESDGAHVS